jgi:hypothetical protein
VRFLKLIKNKKRLYPNGYNLFLLHDFIVVEPGERSLQTYRKIKQLGNDIGIKKVFVVGNKIRNIEDENLINNNVEGFC